LVRTITGVVRRLAALGSFSNTRFAGVAEVLARLRATRAVAGLTSTRFAPATRRHCLPMCALRAN